MSARAETRLRDGSGELPDAQCVRRDDEERMIRREQAVEQKEEGDA